MEHWEELKPGGLRFVWADHLFRPGTDTFLLSSLPRLRPGLRVCDLGCGTGLLGLLLMQRQPDLRIAGLDIQPEAALTTLNSAMALRGAETGSFTTVDLCVLKGSEATFYKFGAAPSYLKKNGAVRRITGSSLPVGLRGTPAAPDITTVTLEPGSFAVMISDGVADPSRDEWLQDLLAGWGGDDPQTLANLILSESVRRERLQDDCAVQVLYRLPESEQPV